MRFGVSHLIFLRSDIVNCLISKLLVFFRFLGQKGRRREREKEYRSDIGNFGFPFPNWQKLCQKVQKTKIEVLCPMSDWGDLRFQKRTKKRGRRHRLKEEGKGQTLVRLLWRATAPGLKPLRLPRAQIGGGNLIHTKVDLCIFRCQLFEWESLAIT